ncbi:hypothetical protein KC320_g8049 [Hortaea werneckii]|nr:hypothetical protein KC320_g8049 [Hortaea werneckii]
MDPLSITASCLAILGASTATGKALRKLIDLRKAPEELQQLFNEREASRALLVVIQSTLHKIQGTAVYTENREALEQLLIRFQNEIVRLEALLEYQLTQPEANSNGLPQVRKLQWMRADPKIRDIQQRIRDARSGLKSAFNALNLQQSVDAHQTALQIQTVVFQSQEDSQNRHAELIEEFTSQSTETRRANERLQHSIADVSAAGRELAQIDTRRHEELLSLLRDLQLSQHGGPPQVNAYDAAPLGDSIGKQANNRRIPDATAPSTWAVTCGSSTVKNLLEELGADSGGQARDGYTVSRILVEKDIYTQESLPQDPTDLFEELGFTELHIAVALPLYSGSLSAELLAANFVSVNSTDTAGWTPLHWAAFRGDIASVKLLLEWRAKVDAVDKMGITPLIVASRFGSCECVQILIEEGADVRVMDAHEQTVLFRLSNECAGFVGHFIRSGVQLEQKNVYGATALVDSVTGKESPAVTAALCGMGADIDSRNEFGQNAIIIAVFKNNAGGLETLLQHLQERSELTSTCDSEDIIQISTSNADDTALYDANQGEASHSMPLPRPSRLCHWSPDKRRMNVLHFAAVFGGTQVMKILAGADLSGLDPLQQDQDGDAPDDCFYRYRDFNFAAVRAPLEEGEAAWRTLMDSARRQNGLLIDCQDDESLNDSCNSKKIDKDQVVHWNAGGDGTSLDESGDESQDEETFEDAVQEL